MKRNSSVRPFLLWSKHDDEDEEVLIELLDDPEQHDDHGEQIADIRDRTHDQTMIRQLRPRMERRRKRPSSKLF